MELRRKNCRFRPRAWSWLYANQVTYTPNGGKRGFAENLYRLFALLLLAVTFVLIVWKAWTQSMTIDEVFTYDNWVAGPFSNFYHYTGGAASNNHPLNT